MSGDTVLQIRYYFENFEGKPWHVTPEMQSVRFKSAGETVQGWIIEETLGKPDGNKDIEILSGFSRVLDFYFSVPSSIKNDADLPCPSIILAKK